MEATRDVELAVASEAGKPRARQVSAASTCDTEGTPGAEAGVDVSMVLEEPVNSVEEEGNVAASPRSAGSQSIWQRVSTIRGAFKAPRRLVLAAGFILALCAGIVDVVAYNQLKGFVSHVSGNVAHIGIRIEGNYQGIHDAGDLRQACGLVLSFLMGSIICGLIISKNEVHFGKELYGFALLGNSGFLVAATFVPSPELALYLAAAACGLQNGICTMHFGAVCRTTHVTGLVTDLGTAIGRVMSIAGSKWCRRRRLDILDRTEIEVDMARIGTYCCLLFGFGFGAAAGAWLDEIMGLWAFLMPASITFTGGLSYMVFRQCLKEKLERLEVRRVEEEVHEVEEVLERTKGFLMLARDAEKGTCPVRFTELDAAMRHTIDVMHDVEASIEELFSNSSPHASPCKWFTPTNSKHEVTVSSLISPRASPSIPASRSARTM